MSEKTALPILSSQGAAPSDHKPPTVNTTTTTTTTTATATVMAAATAWKPFNRRQSWNREEQKREMQMREVGTVKSKTGSGFTEKGV
ncbi:hypothetical protein E4U12_004180 [Claviceps purpurea]|nr:hypothetical protein E4U12_004180 [Claviceps purpurea]KAG6146317.1 hypothetical protein E4U28_000760 [Claviceps purpurea]KAG6155912.1 hypothetical protein E4U37_000752 [Claviceps purpurea]KAG6187924.1 hypothetical protein E4U36_007444 [Claviceps purpurea]